MVQGETIYDETTLNIEDLWSGGPFQNVVCIPNACHMLFSIVTHDARVVIYWWKPWRIRKWIFASKHAKNS